MWNLDLSNFCFTIPVFGIFQMTETAPALTYEKSPRR